MSQPFLFFSAEIIQSFWRIRGRKTIPPAGVPAFQQKMWIRLCQVCALERPAWLSPLCHESWAVFRLIRVALQMGVGSCADLLECFFQRPSLGPAFSSHNSADGFLFRD